MRLRLPASPVEHSAAARAFAFAGFAVAVAAMAVYGQTLVAPGIALAGAAAGHVTSWRRRDRPRGVLRQVVIAGLVFACLAYLLLDSVGALFGGVLPQFNFAIFLVAVTSFDLKTRRNLYSSLWISLAVLYLAAVYAWDYPFGIFVLAWTACLAGFWLASHHRHLRARLAVPGRPALGALGCALVAGLALFELLPQPTTRPDTPLVVSLPSAAHFQGELENPALPLVQFGDSSGAQNSVDLHFRGRPGDGVVMYVRTGAPAYWRGLVFDHYSGGEWTATRSATEQLPPYLDRRRLPVPAAPQLGTFVQVFRVMRTIPGLVYSAQPLQSVYFPAAELRRDAYGTLHTPGPLRPGQTYSVVSYLLDQSSQSLRDPSGPDDLATADRDFGALSQRARDLARSAVAEAGPGRFDQVMALTRFLQTGYRYTLELGHVPGGEDPVDWFLFDARAGYCEQFATAETLMLRSLGIPARLATGYSTGDYDPTLDQSVVRERDAHAWVEVFFPGRGWVPVDSSPGFPALAAARFPNRVAAGGLARVIPHLQVGGAGAAIGGLGAAALLPGLVAAAVAVVAGLAWLLARRPRRPRPGPRERDLLRLYARAQRRMTRRRGPPETPREYAAAMAGSPLAPVLDEITAAVERGAFGGRWPDPGTLNGLAAKLGRR